MAVGALCAYGFNLAEVRRRLAAPVLQWERSSPRWFYAALFLLTFQFATLFSSLRGFALAVYQYAGMILGRL